ncbi:MAG TPA: hypothetical protein VHH53_03740, partial [Pseudonocardiaceae bacterium]|nr:hypothetical protein [Pseudonocardiaceae bacterium]
MGRAFGITSSFDPAGPRSRLRGDQLRWNAGSAVSRYLRLTPWQSTLPFKSVGVAEEDAVDRAEVVDGAITGCLIDQPLPVQVNRQSLSAPHLPIAPLGDRPADVHTLLPAADRRDRQVRGAQGLTVDLNRQRLIDKAASDGAI